MRLLPNAFLMLLLGSLGLSSRSAFGQNQPVEIHDVPENGAALNSEAHLAVQPAGTNTFVEHQYFDLRGRTLSDTERIEVSLAAAEIPADGRTATKLSILLKDASGKMLPDAIKVRLETERGQFRLADGRLASAATIVVTGGRAELELVSSNTPGSGLVRISSNTVSAADKINFKAQQRDIFAIGIADLTHSVGRKSEGSDAVTHTGLEDNFHKWDSTDESGAAYQNSSSRVAGFMTGTLFGDFVATGSYDSQKITQKKFFSDIDPYEYYPTYGDTSVVQYDARSMSKLYLRVDQQKNYVMHGDYLSHDSAEPIRLGSYMRTLTGVKGHYETDKVSATAFAAKTSRTTMVDEQPGLGLSGPYSVSQPNAVTNSEQISILVRDRYQPSTVISRTNMTRYIDYDFEPFSGRLIFRIPVPSVDENLNPVSIRATYEIEGGGPKYWVGGGEASAKLGDMLKISGRYAKDDNPSTNKILGGATAEIQVDKNTLVTLDGAHSSGTDYANVAPSTTSPLFSQNGYLSNASVAGLLAENPEGNAYKAEILHQDDALKASAFMSRTDAGFENSAAGINSGRREAGVKADYALNETVSANVNGRYSEDLINPGEQSMLSASVRKQLTPRLKVEAGMNRVREDYAPGFNSLGSFATPSTPSTANPTQLNNNNFASDGLQYNPFASQIPTQNCATQDCRIDRSYTSAFASARYSLTDAWSIDGLAEQSVEGGSGQRFSLGTDYRFKQLGRVYGRYEKVDGLSTNYGIADDQTSSQRFIVGVDTAYTQNGNIFEELRLANGVEGRETINAAGVRNIFHLSDSLVANTSVENQIINTKANGTQTAKALAGGLEYTASPLWRMGGRLEYRVSDTQENWLSSASATRYLNNDWSVLARNIWLSSHGAGVAEGQNQTQDRLQLGLAYRDTTTNLWNALGRYEHNINRNTTSVNTANYTNDVVAASANYRPAATWTLSGSTAYKHQTDQLDGPDSNFNAQLVSLRLLHDLNDRFDVGLLVSHTWGGGTSDNGTGAELGYRVMKNMWLSGGYISGRYADSELFSANSSWHEFYVRLRFKFDENTFTR